MKKEIDYMEYSSDVPAQAAYVTNDLSYSADLVPTMTSYTAPSGVVSCSSEDATRECWHAFANDGLALGSSWESATTTGYIQYQFASAKIIRKYTIGCVDHAVGAARAPKTWTLSGSNDGTNWDVYDTQTDITTWTQAEIKTFTFSNTTAYLYYRITVSANNGDVSNLNIGEIEFMSQSPFLQSYSEATIKTQGSYALKAVAAITDSLNKTLTHTFASPLNLTGVNTLKLDMRASRTGANVKLGLHDTGGTTTEITPTINSADTYQTVTWDLSGVSDANKNVIDTFIITPTNADAANTVYVDNFIGELYRQMVFISD